MHAKTSSLLAFLGQQDGAVWEGNQSPNLFSAGLHRHPTQVSRASTRLGLHLCFSGNSRAPLPSLPSELLGLPMERLLYLFRKDPSATPPGLGEGKTQIGCQQDYNPRIQKNIYKLQSIYQDFRRGKNKENSWVTFVFNLLHP